MQSHFKLKYERRGTVLLKGLRSEEKRSLADLKSVIFLQFLLLIKTVGRESLQCVIFVK